MPPEETPPPESYKFNFWETDPKRNFAPWFLIFCGVLILVSIALIGWLKFEMYQANKVESISDYIKNNPPGSVTSDAWQTYRNEEYGFEFKYPKGTIKPAQIIEKNANEIEFNYWGEMYDDYLTSFRINIIENQSEPGTAMAHVVSPDKKYMVTISRGQESGIDTKNLDLLLSTFKFNEPGIYRNEKYGVEFKYPIPTNLTLQEGKYDKADYVGLFDIRNEPHADTFFVLFLEHKTDLNKTRKENLTILAKERLGLDYVRQRDYLDGILVEASTFNGTYYFTYHNNIAVEITGTSLSAWENQGSLFNQILSTFKFIETGVKTAGTLSGEVTIGPNCPVEQEGVPCPPTPEAYAAREFLVLDSNGKQIASFHADPNGNFSLNLSPGTYTVTTAKTGMGFMSGDLPKTITIKAGQTVTLNIDIDTGIR